MFFLRCLIRRNRLRRFYEHHFGLTPFPDEAFRAFMAPMIVREPWYYYNSMFKENIDYTVKADKNKYQIILDLKNFSLDEITVKTKDGHIIVEGKHEEREDEHSHQIRHFARSYALPEDCKAESVVSSLSEGVLTVTAPRSAPSGDGERVVPITHEAGKSEDGASEDNEKK